jgi:predicted ATPase/DNA-binding SARP family transcriptional activator
VLDVALLGPLEVTVDGAPVEVPSGKASELLARLALEAGELVSAERLVEDLWASTTTEVRRNTLQSKVAMLRRALGPVSVASRDGGYALDVEADHVDVLAVQRAAATAARLREGGEPEQAAELCGSALRLFRGTPLQVAADAEWTSVPRTRVDEAHTTLLEVRFWARLELGGAGSVIGELEGAVAEHPFHEGLWELLITALYRTGRQADALAAYQRVRTQLGDELGLDPGPALQRLERDILAQEVAGTPVTAASDGSGGTARGNLPSMSAGLVGRDADVEELAELLSRERLVEVIGPGGIGKTAVALDVGRRLLTSDAVDAVWLARLESTATRADVVDVLIAALHGPGSEAALFERLRASSALVILDNCEHVVEVAADLAVRLLDHAPALRILCTSQLPLEIDGERAVELAPLELSDAVELFARRASRLTGAARDDESVLDLCRSLDGLPLAIELAAARTRTLTVEEITRRLDDRFSVLKDPSSRRPERRRSLRSTIGWSYDLLFPDDQRGLWALAAFAGGAPLPAVEFVLEALGVPAAATIDVVDRLVTRSLVTLHDDSGADGGPRYRLLDSIRAFALEAMAEAGEAELALESHARWYADLAAGSTSGVRSADQDKHLRFARTERANIDAALAWSVGHDPLRALDLASGFGWAWVVLGDSRGAERIVAALEATAGLDTDRQRAVALLLAGWIEASTGDLALARQHVDAATGLAESSDDLDLQARCAYYLAYVVSHHGEFREALALTDRSRAIYDGLHRPWDQAANALFAARAAISAADEQRSIEAVADVERWLEAVEDPWLHARGEAIKGELARVQHRFGDAVMHLTSAAEASHRLGFLQTEAYQLSSLGRAQCQTGDYAAGIVTLRTSIAKAEATGDVRLAALIRVHLGRALRAEGDVVGARAALASAAAWHREAGGGEQALLGECLLCALEAADGEPLARDRLVALLTEAKEQDAAHVEVFALDTLARLAADSGREAEARELLDRADRRMEAASHFITDHDRTDAHWVRRTDRSHLGAR